MAECGADAVAQCAGGGDVASRGWRWRRQVGYIAVARSASAARGAAGRVVGVAGKDGDLELDATIGRQLLMVRVHRVH